MPSVIERLGHSIVGDEIIYDEREVAWDAADRIAGHRLDRRKNYAVINGQICSAISWTQQCSGCDGAGCGECGHVGKRRRSHWMPDEWQ